MIRIADTISPKLVHSGSHAYRADLLVLIEIRDMQWTLFFCQTQALFQQENVAQMLE